MSSRSTTSTLSFLATGDFEALAALAADDEGELSILRLRFLPEAEGAMVGEDIVRSIGSVSRLRSCVSCGVGRKFVCAKGS